MGISDLKGLFADQIPLRGGLGHGRKERPTLTKETLQDIRSDLQDGGKSTGKLDNLLNNYDKIDLNGDGISADELKTYQKKPQPTKDANESNEKFTKSDLEALREKIARDGGKLPQGLERVIADFEKVDADKDGQVSTAELQAYAKAKGVTLPRLGTRASLLGILARSDNTRGALDDAVDLSNLFRSAERANAVATLLNRNYTPKGTLSDVETEFGQGISPIITDPKT